MNDKIGHYLMCFKKHGLAWQRVMELLKEMDEASALVRRFSYPHSWPTKTEVDGIVGDYRHSLQTMNEAWESLQECDREGLKSPDGK